MRIPCLTCPLRTFPPGPRPVVRRADALKLGVSRPVTHAFALRLEASSPWPSRCVLMATTQGPNETGPYICTEASSLPLPLSGLGPGCKGGPVSPRPAPGAPACSSRGPDPAPSPTQSPSRWGPRERLPHCQEGRSPWSPGPRASLGRAARPAGPPCSRDFRGLQAGPFLVPGQPHEYSRPGARVLRVLPGARGEHRRRDKHAPHVAG